MRKKTENTKFHKAVSIFLRSVINVIIGVDNLLKKKVFTNDNQTISKIPSDFKMKNCCGKVMVIIDDLTFVEGFEDTPEFRSSSFSKAKCEVI